MSWAVAHVITRLDLGGAQLATLYQAAHGAFGRDHKILLHGPGGQLERDAERMAGVNARVIPHLVREVSPLNDARAITELTAALREARRNAPRLLVHTHSSKAGILGRIAARAAGAHCIVHTAHGFGHSHHGGSVTRRLFTWAERGVGRWTHGFTADSAANLHQGHREGLFGNAPGRVVRCGIDVPYYAAAPEEGEAVRRELRIPPNVPIVLSLSVLKPQKDPLTLVEVAAAVARTHGNVHFLVAGDGELRAQVEAAVTAHGLQGRFHLLGWRHDVPRLLAAASLLIMTSRWEGLPQAFPQAMAAGLPVVATTVDGAAEAVDHGGSGFLCPPGDVTGLARSVATLLSSESLRRAMGEAGRRRVEAFSQETMVRALDRFYEGLTSPDS